MKTLYFHFVTVTILLCFFIFHFHSIPFSDLLPIETKFYMQLPLCWSWLNIFELVSFSSISHVFRCVNVGSHMLMSTWHHETTPLTSAFLSSPEKTPDLHIVEDCVEGTANTQKVEQIPSASLVFAIPLGFTHYICYWSC